MLKKKFSGLTDRATDGRQNMLKNKIKKLIETRLNIIFKQF